jgi:DNA-binding beta-propeller fold protein YncE
MQKLKFLVLLLLIATLVVACGDTSPSTPAATTTNAAATTAAGQLDSANILVKSAVAITQGGDFKNPLDSTPDADGTNTYFIASNSKGAGVFKVASAGGNASEVAVGAPFVAPHAIAISPDGKQIFVADTKAGKGGQIFMLPIAGGTPTVVKGSEGTAPQNLTIVDEGGQNELYFTGKEASGQPAVFKLIKNNQITNDGTAAVLAKGAPLVEPDGIVVNNIGSIYVADRSAGGSGNGQVFEVTPLKVIPIVTKVKTGNPAGITLSQDGLYLMVSAFQADTQNDQVLVVNLADKRMTSVTSVVGENHNAGGVHRIPAGKQNIFAWADLTAGSGGGGLVYRIELK